MAGPRDSDDGVYNSGQGEMPACRSRGTAEVKLRELAQGRQGKTGTWGWSPGLTPTTHHTPRTDPFPSLVLGLADGRRLSSN